MAQSKSNVKMDNSLWTKCFFKVYDRCIEEKRINVPFSEVDDLVIRCSKMKTEDLISFLSGETDIDV